MVQIVTDDRPFLVDSVTMEVLRQGWSIREVFHPQFLVDRDLGGTLHDILRPDQADAASPRRGTGEQPVHAVAESWMHLEILPPSGQGHPDQLAAALEQGLREVLRLVEEAVEDWAKMQHRAQESVAMLRDEALPADRRTEADTAAELLDWLAQNHFTFLGYREYRYQAADSATDTPARYVSVPATGLGILRADVDLPGSFHALPVLARPQLMVITKDNHKSRVHRPAYLDYLGIRLLDADGDVIGERRFLGLFASTAYSEAVGRIPLLRQKAQEVLRRSRYDESSHGGKAIMDVLDTYPRDELFQAPIDELAPAVEKVAHLKERRQVRLFVRRDAYGRYLSCLVYLPRDRYTTAVRNKMQDILLDRVGGSTIDFTARVTESVLARLHFVVAMPEGATVGEVDVRALERELTLATRSWNDGFAELLSGAENPDVLATMMGSLPEGYKEDYLPHQGILDLQALLGLSGPDDMAMAMYRPDRADDDADLRFKIFRWSETLSLSKILPHLSLLGVDVVDERPYELTVADDKRAFVYDFGVVVPGGRAAVEKRWDTAARNQFMDAFAASYGGRSEPDRFNALVMGADLGWRQVGILRAIGRYLRQTGSTYSQTYVAQALNANVEIARLLVALFETKFDPGLSLSKADRADEVEDLRDKIKLALDSVASLDHDKIIRSYLAILDAVIRTSFYQPGRDTIALKLLPRKIPDLPQPRPAYEIFVYSPRVEGVHLRFGSVARGGLRWSDRAEDFRTEILGLVKAQMVKNTVIVPVGAKGGFYCKQLPDPAVDREAWLAEGKACYRLFIASLLELTDNIVDGAVVPPEHVVRYDGDDPYLVVAADKGTATFSDIANGISIDHGFWLGDAFASGGLGRLRPQGDGHHRQGRVGVGPPALPRDGHRHPDPGLHLRRDRRHEWRRVRQRHAAQSAHQAGGRLRPPAPDHRPRSGPRGELGRAEAAVRPAALELGRLRHQPDLRRRWGVPEDAEVDHHHAGDAHCPRHRRRRGRALTGGADQCVPAGAGRSALERRHRHLREGDRRESRAGRGQGQRRAPGQRRGGAGPLCRRGRQPRPDPARPDRVRDEGRRVGQGWADQHRLHRQLGRRRHLRPRGQHQDPAGR